jgi:4-amino-4-deoxy-L-arabinose transferase-like glycosyltransferase
MIARVRRFVPVAAMGLVLAALHVVWLARFRWGYFLDWDEAAYLGIALQFHDALLDGPAAYVEAQRAAGAQPPVVPTSAFPILVVFGRDNLEAALATAALWSVLLVVATYGVASRLVSPRWALLAALCVGTAPVVADYSRMFHFAVPAAALLTSALWALLLSEGLRRTRWVVAAGVLLALTTTARTMTIAYVAAVLAGAAIPLLAADADRRIRARNLALLGAVTAAVAALWWVPNRGAVWPYLSGSGYGGEAAGYGRSHPILSAQFWTVDLQKTTADLQLPLAVALAGCVALAFPRLRSGLRRPDVLLLVSLVVGGWLALVTTRNQGTAFALPWVPALVVLAVASAARVDRRALRLGVAGALVAVSAWNVLVMNGVDRTLARPRFASGQLVTDGLGLVHRKSAFHGYGLAVPPASVPALHREWDELDEGLARFLVGRVPHPTVGVATGDYFLTETRIHLASVLHLRRTFLHGLVRSPQDVRRWNVLVTADAPTRPAYPVDRAAVEQAARVAGFERARTFRAPDGRSVFVWVRRG